MKVITGLIALATYALAAPLGKALVECATDSDSHVVAHCNLQKVQTAQRYRPELPPCGLDLISDCKPLTSDPPAMSKRADDPAMPYTEILTVLLDDLMNVDEAMNATVAEYLTSSQGDWEGFEFENRISYAIDLLLGDFAEARDNGATHIVDHFSRNLLEGPAIVQTLIPMIQEFTSTMRNVLSAKPIGDVPNTVEHVVNAAGELFTPLLERIMGGPEPRGMGLSGLLMTVYQFQEMNERERSKHYDDLW